MKKFETKYGYFTENGKEYVITEKKTPKPWINVISNGNYGLVVSQIGGGFSWLTHSEFNRLNRWHQDLIQDNWGKYFYFKNNKTNEIWSPLWMPLKSDIEKYEARYGTGYAKFQSVYKNIKVSLNLFVPFNADMEIWNFKIENDTDEDVSISIYSYFEFCLGSSADHHREFHKTLIETEFDKNSNSLIATKRLWEIPLGDRGHWNIEYPYWGFISSNKSISEYEGDKENFIGKYGSLDKPLAVINGKLTNSTGKWNDSIGTIKVDLEIKSGGEDFANFFIGITDKKDELSSLLKKYYLQEETDKALNEVIKYWEESLGTFSIDTPDEGMNFMVNTWLRYQAISGRLWGRTAYYQQSGAFGFRDQLQDSMVYLPIDPELTLQQIKLHARHQFSDGTVLHWWHPISETGLSTKMTDDLLWLPFIIFHYLDETNDLSILEINEPCYDDSTQITILEHSKRAIDKVLTRFSERGLPLIGAGDWNDGLSAVGLDMKGESIWMAEFLYIILNKFSTLLLKLDDNKNAEYYKSKANLLKDSFDKYAWDGDWFFRATKDNGQKIGSKENEEGKIFLNAQTWSVISSIGDNDKLKMAMDSVTKYLLKNNGCLLLWPAYTKPDKYIGYLSRYAPARRENGGVYTHAATWAIQAYAMLKDPINSFLSYQRLSPINNNLNDPDKYVAEPFVTPGNIDGPDSPNYGMGGWTWYTGSAQWFQKSIVDWILGVRASEEGLIIDPCIPKEWKQYTVKRKFRGAEYYITVKNPESVSSGVKYLIVNGKIIKGNLIKPEEFVNKYEVEVILE